MPRNGSGIYSKPAGTTAIPNTTIASGPFNSLADDLVADANAVRPIGAGGTGAASLLSVPAAIACTIWLANIVRLHFFVVSFALVFEPKTGGVAVGQ
jgi:hypothetical protein